MKIVKHSIFQLLKLRDQKVHGVDDKEYVKGTFATQNQTQTGNTDQSNSIRGHHRYRIPEEPAGSQEGPEGKCACQHENLLKEVNILLYKII